MKYYYVGNPIVPPSNPQTSFTNDEIKCFVESEIKAFHSIPEVQLYTTYDQAQKAAIAPDTLRPIFTIEYEAAEPKKMKFTSVSFAHTDPKQTQIYYDVDLSFQKLKVSEKDEKANGQSSHSSLPARAANRLRQILSWPQQWAKAFSHLLTNVIARLHIRLLNTTLFWIATNIVSRLQQWKINLQLFFNQHIAPLLRKIFLDTPLIWSTMLNEPVLVKMFLAAGANIEAINNTGHTPLHTAALFGDLQTTNVLIAAGANIEAISDNQNTPLFTATLVGRLEIVKALIKAGANVNTTDNKNGTLLHIAAFTGRLGIASALINAGANLNVVNKQGNAPIHLAIFQKQIAMAKYLIDKGANIEATSSEQPSLLHLTITTEQIEIAQHLINHGANIEALYLDQTPLHFAIGKGQIEIAKHLIDKGANIEALYYNQTPLHFAIEKGQVETAKHLIDKGANIEALYLDQTPLHFAIATGQVEIAKYLIDKGANIEALHFNQTLLHYAIATGQVEIAKHLIDKGANIEALYLDQTPLHFAIGEGQIEIAKHLIDKGANIEALFGVQTPLHYAIEKGQIKIAKLLINHGANIEALYHDQMPLPYAIQRGQAKIAICLFDALMRAKKIDKNKVLHDAVEYDIGGNLNEFVRFSIQNGAKVNSIRNGLTLLHRLAKKESPSKALIKTLLIAGADFNLKDKNQATVREVIQANPVALAGLQELLDERASLFYAMVAFSKPANSKEEQPSSSAKTDNHSQSKNLPDLPLEISKQIVMHAMPSDYCDITKKQYLNRLLFLYQKRENPVLNSKRPLNPRQRKSQRIANYHSSRLKK